MGVLNRLIESIKGFHEEPTEIKARFYTRGTGVSYISNVDLQITPKLPVWGTYNQYIYQLRSLNLGRLFYGIFYRINAFPKLGEEFWIIRINNNLNLSELYSIYVKSDCWIRDLLYVVQFLFITKIDWCSVLMNVKSDDWIRDLRYVVQFPPTPKNRLVFCSNDKEHNYHIQMS